MKRNRVAIILASLMLLTGCKTTEAPERSTARDSAETSVTDPPEAIAPATVSRKDDGRPLLVCFGDSLTAGYGTDPGQSYPDRLQKELDARGYHYRVVNEGVSGATSKDGVARLPTIIAMKPAAVIVEFGGNDGLRGLPVSELRANLDTMVKGLQGGGAKVMLAGMLLPPDYGPDYVNQFVASYPMIAKKYRVPLVPFLLQGVFGVDGMMQRDRIHATAKGNAIVAQTVLPVVQPLLQK